MKLPNSLSLAACFTMSAPAVTIGWDGDGSLGSGWFSGTFGDTNWAGDGFPATGDDVVINAPLSGGSWVSSLLVPMDHSSVTVGDLYVEPQPSHQLVSWVSGMNVTLGVFAAVTANHRDEISWIASQAKHKVKEEGDAFVKYAISQNQWGSQDRTPEIMAILLTYGTTRNHSSRNLQR